jgi:arylformamidase
MKTIIALDQENSIAIDLSKPIDISIPLNPEGPNPSCYYAEEVSSEVIRSGDFVGSIKEGGPVNYYKVSLTPHGNGTHTECYGHITDSGATVNQMLETYNFFAQLISVQPRENEQGDWIIDSQDIAALMSDDSHDALIIRTLPNDDGKLSRAYSGKNPPYFTKQAIEFIVAQGISHLLVDLPSIDREQDDGALLAHRAFWRMDGEPRNKATITELIYVPSSVQDGSYFLQLSIPSLEMDAVPSKPIIYKISELSK